MKRLALYMLMIGLILPCAACARGHSTQTSSANYGSPKSFSNELVFDAAKTNFSTLSLQIDLALVQGDYSWTLLDPSGNVVWSGANQGKLRLKDRKSWLSPQPGNWLLQVHGVEVQGNVKITWQGNR